jgi:hypothetical protein
LLLPDKFKPLGITKYDAKQDPIEWLRCYALSIENAGGNNDTKWLYFPFCLDQAPLTWLESLDKHSIDKWDQLKEQFTSNFAGAMGQLGTRMDMAMVKQEQGETLRKYMCRFFDKRATVVDVTDKEVIDLFQGGLYHRRTFEDFGRRRPKSIPHLKDMITSWADEEDKANAKYDAIRGKNKQNTGGGSGNNGNQGGRNNKQQQLLGSQPQAQAKQHCRGYPASCEGEPVEELRRLQRLAKGEVPMASERQPHHRAVLPAQACTQGYPRATAPSRQKGQEEERRRQQRLPGTRQDRQRPLRRTTHQAGAKVYPSRSYEHRTSGPDPTQVVGGTHYLLPRGSMD